MKISKPFSILALAFIMSGFSNISFAQQKTDDQQMEQYEQKVTEIVNFLEYFLNTLGDKSTSARDKDVIVSQSYTKIFRDANVQVEDDLDEERDVITNKDVQAYLKDIDFFFKTVKFDFNIEDISHYVNDQGDLFFKVTMTRNLKGTTIENDSVNNTKKRFIEVNLDPEEQDLKIVSFYTNQFSQKEALAKWWKELSYEWKAIFKRKAGITQTATDSDIKNISQIDELDISGNRYIVDIEPLSQLTQLRRLNLSKTNIEDLKPIRNLTNIEELDLSYTQVKSLEPLKYASSLKYLEAQNTPLEDANTISRLNKLEQLNISRTQILDFTSIGKASNLQKLNMAGTQILNLNVIEPLANLKELNINSTRIDALSPLKAMNALEVLKADSTPVYSLQPLATLKSLKVLSINFTTIDDLSPLSSCKSLEKIYCDSSNISKEDANDFMSANKGVLVVFESDNLKHWWAELPVAWQNVIEQFVAIDGNTPSKEDLAKITAIDSINIDNNIYIENIEPLSQLRKLHTVIISNTATADLSPLSGLRNIEYLDVSNTKIEDFGIINSMEGLSILKANRTNFSNIDTLKSLKRLKRLEVDYTNITALQAKKILETHPDCLIIFESDYLQSWWADLSETWRSILATQTTLAATPSTAQLHKLIELKQIEIIEQPVSNITPLSNFIRLESLKISGTGVSDISVISDMHELKTLQLSKGPISDLSALKSLKKLEKLDISNTPVSNLSPLEDLTSLEEINCAGTQIKKLSSLDNLRNLQYLDCSNTNVKKLDEISHLQLKTVKCYNTRISSGRIEDFKQANPECNIIHY